jgi:hypothetical protein
MLVHTLVKHNSHARNKEIQFAAHDTPFHSESANSNPFISKLTINRFSFHYLNFFRTPVYIFFPTLFKIVGRITLLIEFHKLNKIKNV